MDVGSRNGYPAAALSNFSPHPFVIDGVICASMEGFLQALKHKDVPSQLECCKLVGFKAKKKGSKKNWQRTQMLHWAGDEYKRDGVEYQLLLDRAYAALSKNEKFRKALIVSGDVVLTHSIGRRKQSETVLTVNEFCGRLMKIREQIS